MDGEGPARPPPRATSSAAASSTTPPTPRSEQELNAEIAAAIAAVEALGPPARETLFDDVYAELPWHLAEQRAELLRMPPAPSHEGGAH